MAYFDKARTMALLVGASLLASAAMAQTAPVAAPVPQTPATPDDMVSEVTVTGTKLPDALATKAATCEVLIQNDPSFRAAIAVASAAGSPLMGATIYLPTRAPRSPDYRAAPLTEPGSAIPEVSQRWRGPRTINGLDASGAKDVVNPTEPSVSGEANPQAQRPFAQATNASQTTDYEKSNTDGTESVGAGIEGMSIDDAITACRGFYVQGGGAASQGRSDIAGRDRTLPTGLVLFDDGRYEEALGYFQQAYRKLQPIDGGDEAALMIGKIKLFALGAKSDPKDGVMWLKRAAGAAFSSTTSMPVFDPRLPDNNTAIGEAALLLGQLYLTGSAGVAKDPAEARKWFARSVEVGHVAAGKTLGDMYYAGVGGPKDLKKAFNEYNKAATLGHAPSQYALADMYYTGEYGGPVDKTKALAWYNEAAKLEQPDALYALASAYDTGDGVSADPQKAVALFKAAALNGNVSAMTAMGTYFYEGKQLGKDDATARQWFQTAATAGDPDAMFNLAAMMVNGQGGDVDRKRAWVWFKLAQAKGAANAAPAIAALEKKMSAEEKSAASALLSPKTS